MTILLSLIFGFVQVLALSPEYKEPGGEIYCHCITHPSLLGWLEITKRYYYVLKGYNTIYLTSSFSLSLSLPTSLPPSLSNFKLLAIWYSKII
jgi:hypothetical protein